jgi:PAS domain S-box-containing protein
VTELRPQAEDLLRATERDVAAMPVKDVQQLVHELQVHQIELEMQNENLRRAQVELEAARDRYADLYDFSPAGHFTLDLSGTIVEANLRAATLLGPRRQELIGKPFVRFVTSDDRPVFHRHWQAVLKTGTRQTCEVQLQKESGPSCWVYLESLAMSEESGPITRWRTALLDISSRKRAEQEKTRLIRDLARSQQHFQTLFNWTPSAIGISTVADGRLIDVNEGFCRLTGYGREEVIGRTTVELGLWADPLERETVLREIREQGSLHNREGRLQTKSGEIRSLMVSVDSIQLGSTSCLIYLAHDITERKRAEEVVRLAKFSMERAADAVYWIDPQARILDVNEAACVMLGYSKDELCAMTVHDLNLDFPADRWPGFWAETHRRGTMILETAHRAKNGRLIPVEVSVNYLTYEGKEYHCAFARDITERKRAEAERCESEARFRAILDNCPGMVFLKDAEGRYLHVNRQFERAFHRTREQIVGKTDEAIFAPEDAAAFRANDLKVLWAGVPLEFEEVVMHDDGPHTSIVSKFPLCDGNGTPYALCGITTDITDRKQMEVALRQSEERLSLAMATGRVGLFDHNHLSGTIYWSCTMRELLGVDGGQAASLPVYVDSVHPEERAVILAAIESAHDPARDGLYVVEHRVVRPDGSIHWVSVRSQTSFEGLGTARHPVRTIGTMTDITERKRQEVAREESDKRYRSIFENAVEGIFQTTLDGKYVAVNPALARMYGYDSPDDLIAAITDIASQVYVDPGRRDEFLRLMQEQEEVAGFEALVYRKDGSFIWISENVRALRDMAGVLVGYEGTVENITERKLVEKQLHDTLDHVRMLSGRIATVQEEERTRIARELHDELGVGLTCLKIDLSRLQTMMSEGGGANVRKKVGDKIRSMIGQVDTTIVSVQRLVTELRPAILDDLGLVAAIEWQCQDFQKRTGIPCTCVTSANDIAMKPDRATTLFRICQEALTNVARHAQATAVTIKLESQSDCLELVVADNGVGISDAEVSDRRSLGLLGMKERATLFGGDLTIQSRPGKGTTVTACLPRPPS